MVFRLRQVIQQIGTMTAFSSAVVLIRESSELDKMHLEP